MREQERIDLENLSDAEIPLLPLLLPVVILISYIAIVSMILCGV